MCRTFDELISLPLTVKHHLIRKRVGSKLPGYELGESASLCSRGLFSRQGGVTFRRRPATGLGNDLAEWTGLEPATPGVTGRYSNQLNYHSAL